MLNFITRLEQPKPHDVTITLPFDIRQKSRFKAALDNGEEVSVVLSRGVVLREGDCLQAEQGDIVRVNAATETVSTVTIDDPLMLARAAYHLGNRHVPLQVSATFLRYQHDHVLDDMLKQMGIEPVCEQATFEPEAGAYSGGGHHHHQHSHD